MSTGSPIRGLLFRLIDDAAVFPPGNASVATAVEEHRRHRRAWYADCIGPLLLRPAQVAGALDLLRSGDDLGIGLVAQSGLLDVAYARDLLLDHDESAALVQIEVALPAAHDIGAATQTLLTELAFSVPTYVEVPRTGWQPALDVLAEDGAEHAKYRTGGETPQAHPSESELAAFLRGCLDRNLGFKLTAGLHHAVRTTTDRGFEQHGLLNVLAAVTAGLDGADHGDLAALLADRSVDSLVALVDKADVAAVRRVFRSFGCCGVTDPLDELVVLGLLSPED
ncbi:MAG: hypothetical protein ABWZ26_03420 [Candidatus Nanopelagicales bacterium]